MSLKHLKVVKRMFSTGENTPRVCIVGAGTAGFYAAMHLTKNLANVNVDLLEKLPVPFGLVRYGVAPDHPEVKNVINQFTKVAQHPNVKYYGNVTLGKDVSLTQLRQHYHAVLLAYGADEDRTLGIENEDAKNVIAARNFVGWYNGLPSDKDLKVDLSHSTAAILGQGNVALDVARILLSPIDELRKTDITEYALQTLAESKLKELYLIGRRGPLQVAFTIKELREQLKLKNCLTIWREKDFKGVEEIIPNLGRPRKRLTELMIKSLKENHKINEGDLSQKYFMPIFFRSPNRFLIDEQKQLTGVQLNCNKLMGDKPENQTCVPTEEVEVINCGLAFRSIGYKSIQVDNDLIFTPHGTVANDKGCVSVDNSTDLANLYVAGWLGTGPVGVILHTMGNAFHVAKLICEDLKSSNGLVNKGGFEEIKKALPSNNEIVNWNGWEKINKHEVQQGELKGKPREKLCSVKEMLEIAL
ncbi:NADPH:adrenodoxin oxidoreductase, mitochondrial [Ostrinia furnacalis]|uniref:NADPH:adrenodoxin oxidoreductase, mitochondrial n=1 Tax=Ostrinia furnacalis TaxID=93504 RepID=UPI00103E5324|nr:NADPH:adrenodoxin oxidoreductase, mitochondrial [Ostrinia furnacalis]